MKATAYIGLGSNLGDGRRNLLTAWQRLATMAGVEPVALSAPFLTAPVGMASDQWFTNAVGELRTDLAPRVLLSAMLTLEAAMGRVRDRARPDCPADRPVDLDLLYYNELVLEEPGLILPHPEIGRRLFVLVPLVELAPTLRDPGSGITVERMLDRLVDGRGADLTAMIRKTVWEEKSR